MCPNAGDMYTPIMALYWRNSPAEAQPAEARSARGAATCHDDEVATWQHVGGEADTHGGNVADGEGREAKGSVRIGGTAESLRIFNKQSLCRFDGVTFERSTEMLEAD